MLGFILALIPLVVLLPEFVKTGLNLFTLSIILVGILLGIRIVQKKPILTEFYLRIYSLIALLLVVLASTALLITLFTYENFIFSKIYIRIEVLGYMVALAVTTWFIQQNNKFVAHNIKNILLIAPFVYGFVVALLFLLPNNLLFNLSLEDNIFENLQFITLFSGGVAAIFVGFKLFSKNKLCAFIILVFGIVVLITAGEEISWGQRVFNFGNDKLQSINIQNETNVHNIKSVHYGIPIVYSILGFLGSFGALVINNFKIFSKDTRVSLVPNSYLFFFFFMPFVCNILNLKYGPLTEASELLLYVGIGLFMIQTKLLKKRVL